MNILLTVVLAPVLGLTVRSRGVALVAYLLAESFLFTFQSVSVLLTWLSGGAGLGGGEGAFGPSPTGFPAVYSQSELVAYGVVNLVIIGAGTGILLLCHWLRARRAARRTDVVTVG